MYGSGVVIGLVIIRPQHRAIRQVRFPVPTGCVAVVVGAAGLVAVVFLIVAMARLPAVAAIPVFALFASLKFN